MAKVVKVAVTDKDVRVGTTRVRLSDPDAALKIGEAILALGGLRKKPRALTQESQETRLALVTEDEPKQDGEKPKRKKKKGRGFIGPRRAKTPPEKLASDEGIGTVLKPREGESSDTWSTRVLLEGGARALDLLRKAGQ